MMSGVPIYVTENFVMSDPGPPHVQVRHELPTSTVQLAGHASGMVVEGLTAKSPWMLGIVVLNVIGIASAVYFLNLLIQGQQQHLKSLLEVQDKQQTEIIQMHQREFDALLALTARESPPPTATVAPPVVTPLPQGRR